MEKPCLFIGSSTGGLEFARAVRTLLANDAKVTMWNEGLPDLENELKRLRALGLAQNH